MIFHNPQYFWLLFLLLPLFFIKKPSGNSRGSLLYSSISLLLKPPKSWRAKGEALLPWLQILAVILLITALARPQVGVKQTMIHRQGIDIILALDVSTSMLAEDFIDQGQRVNRFQIVREVAGDFIQKRPQDRIGIVIFAGRPYILSPLTWDHEWCQKRLDEAYPGMIEDGTGVGSALMTAVNRLKDSSGKSKVIILLTDGNNNTGATPPATAAEVASSLQIIVHTIGAGSKGPVPYPVLDSFGQKSYQYSTFDLDEALLKEVSQKTNGQFFLATNTKTLKAVFNRIDKMEKTQIKMPDYRDYHELYPYFLSGALLLLILEFLLSHTVLRRLP